MTERWLGPTGATLGWLITAAVIGLSFWSGSYYGTGSTNQTVMAGRLAQDESNNAAAIANVRSDMVTAISGVRNDDASEVASLSRSLADRMDRNDAEMARSRAALYARLAQDESDTKSAVQSVNDIGNRLTRIEAQLDLIVKNVTTTGMVHR